MKYFIFLLKFFHVLLRFFEMVRTEVDLIKSKLKKEVQKEVEESKIEVAALREKLTQAMIDQTSARNVNESLKEELDEVFNLID